MKVDLSRVMVDAEGNPAINEHGKPATLYQVCCIALFSGVKDQSEVDMTKIDKCWELRGLLKVNEPTDLKAEDVTLLKERIGKVYGHTPGIAGQARHMLDQGV